jgi:hypothetical protein
MQIRWLAGLVVLAVIASAIAIAGCPPRNTSQPVPPQDPAPGFEPPPPAPSPPTSPPPTTGAPAGSVCTVAADCASKICEGEGCGAGQGKCAAESRACTFDLVAYCDCDGNTFQASGGCPNRRFQHRGACKPTTPQPTAPKPVGAACLAAAECASGVCEGQGCGPSEPGVCAETSRRCTRDRRAYCGCDGVTFFSSGSCPGRRFSAKASCPAP